MHAQSHCRGWWHLIRLNYGLVPGARSSIVKTSDERCVAVVLSHQKLVHGLQSGHPSLKDST